MRAVRKLLPLGSTERGSEAIEAVIGVPAFILFIGLIIAAGRIAIAREAVDSAASDAARSASIARTQPEAKRGASSAATSSLSSQGLQCVSKQIRVNTSGFNSPVGTPAAVRVSISCRVSLSDVAVPGLPGSYNLTATASSPIDTYRER